MADENAPLPLKAICVVYVIADSVMGLSSLLCLLCGLDQCQGRFIHPAFRLLPYPLQAQVGILFIYASVVGVAVALGLWRLRKWAWNMFLLLFATETAALGVYTLKVLSSGEPYAAPYLMLFDIAAAAYLFGIRKRFS
jgi:hypothetical protein